MYIPQDGEYIIADLWHQMKKIGYRVIDTTKSQVLAERIVALLIERMEKGLLDNATFPIRIFTPRNKPKKKYKRTVPYLFDKPKWATQERKNGTFVKRGKEEPAADPQQEHKNCQR